MEWRFSHFRQIVARFDSTGCVNGAEHKIKRGDVIGYARRGRAGMACCTGCWQRWATDNREAEGLEAGAARSAW
jgi:hypothetical protein